MIKITDDTPNNVLLPTWSDISVGQVFRFADSTTATYRIKSIQGYTILSGTLKGRHFNIDDRLKRVKKYELTARATQEN